jgi:hypothetical protein
VLIILDDGPVGNVGPSSAQSDAGTARPCPPRPQGLAVPTSCPTPESDEEGGPRQDPVTEDLGARGSGLGARGSGLGARGSGLGARGSGLGDNPHRAVV